MAKKKDCYNTLGVTQKASDSEIKKAYRKLAMIYHPDVSKKKGLDPKSAEEKFKEVGEAYAILSDPEKRKMYDQFGWAAFNAGFQPPGQHGPFQTVYTTNTDIDPFEIFREFFGNGFDPFSSFFSDSNSRSSRQVRSNRSSFFVDDLFGINDDEGYEVPIYDREDHRGYSRSGRSQSIYILPITLREALEGTVKTFQIEDSLQTMRLTIPPGIENGTKLKVDGKYHITIDIDTQHSEIKVNKSNIELTLRLPANIIKNGGKIRLPLLSLVINIPVGSKSGQKLRIRGKGINPEGNVIVKLLKK
ncbi:MAG: DnaJ domain-containing protein [Candidatus Hodarchaeales archaeon]|jgi:DnaJ-class molecular chaperone